MTTHEIQFGFGVTLRALTLVSCQAQVTFMAETAQAFCQTVQFLLAVTLTGME